MNKRKLGCLGEAKAAEYLIEDGYQIIWRNFYCFLGEIDIIAEKSGEISFIEVKTRLNTSFGEAREAVGFTKQKRIIKIAQFYLQKYCQETVQPKFDVIEVYLKDPNGANYKVKHLQGAF